MQPFQPDTDVDVGLGFRNAMAERHSSGWISRSPGLSHFYKPTIAGERLTQFERPPFVWEQVRAVGLQAPRVWRVAGPV